MEQVYNIRPDVYTHAHLARLHAQSGDALRCEASAREALCCLRRGDGGPGGRLSAATTAIAACSRISPPAWELALELLWEVGG